MKQAAEADDAWAERVSKKLGTAHESKGHKVAPELGRNAWANPVSLDGARIAMYAAAMEIFSFLPLRRGTLLKLKLDTHLRRPSPNGLITEIYIPANLVKNRNAIRWPVDPASARLLDIYIKKYRAQLAKPGNMFLFPGITDSHRDADEFSDQISKRVAREVGAAFNCHLVRHFAAVRYLRKHPGAYEVAANILAHKNPETTRKFYCGLELDAAARHSNALLTQERRDTRILAIGAFHGGRRVKSCKPGKPEKPGKPANSLKPVDQPDNANRKTGAVR